jgi:hypothetical protein
MLFPEGARKKTWNSAASTSNSSSTKAKTGQKII